MTIKQAWMAGMLCAAAAGAQAAVSPVVAAYGDVFPTLTEQNLAVFITADPSPWYVSFNLLVAADVRLGVNELGPFGGTDFNVTSIRIVSLDGNNIAFGTDTFAVNPFPSPIVALVSVDGLAPGAYALAVAGAGNRSCICGDQADFVSRIQVLPASVVPEPPSPWLMALGLLVFAARQWRGAENRRPDRALH